MPDRPTVRPSWGAVAFAGVAAAIGCARNEPPPSTPAEGVEEAAIRSARAAQNEAIRAGDFPRVAFWWTEDVTIRAGLGLTLTGRDEYRGAFGRDTTVVYERVPNRIDVSDVWPLAWEEGTWVGARRSDGARLIAGRYAAQWIRIDDAWRIRSELFTAIECAGDGCGWPVVPP